MFPKYLHQDYVVCCILCFFAILKYRKNSKKATLVSVGRRVSSSGFLLKKIFCVFPFVTTTKFGHNWSLNWHRKKGGKQEREIETERERGGRERVCVFQMKWMERQQRKWLVVKKELKNEDNNKKVLIEFLPPPPKKKYVKKSALTV